MIQVATGRDDVIRADLDRGVPAAAIASTWGITVREVYRIGSEGPVDEAAPPPALAADQPKELARVGRRLINPFDTTAYSEIDMARDPRAAHFHKERLTEETRRKYRRWINVYLDWCAAVGRVEVPATMMTLEAFAVWLSLHPVTRGKNKGRIGFAPLYIFQALAAVRALHVAMAVNPPPNELARGIVQGHAKERARPGSGFSDGKGKPAITLPTLYQLVLACPTETNSGLRDRALMLLSFVGMCRRHEPPQIDLEDIKEVKEGLEVRIRTTKGGGSRIIRVPHWQNVPDMCPACAVIAWRDRLRSLGVESGPFFRSVDVWDNVHGVGVWAGDPRADLRMPDNTMMSVIARAAIRAQCPEAESLSPHSFRSGGATEAFLAGAQILDIARQGGWADNSPVIFRYIHLVDGWKSNPMLLVGAQAG